MIEGRQFVADKEIFTEVIEFWSKLWAAISTNCFGPSQKIEPCCKHLQDVSSWSVFLACCSKWIQLVCLLVRGSRQSSSWTNRRHIFSETEKSFFNGRWTIYFCLLRGNVKLASFVAVDCHSYIVKHALFCWLIVLSMPMCAVWIFFNRLGIAPGGGIICQLSRSPNSLLLNS